MYRDEGLNASSAGTQNLRAAERNKAPTEGVAATLTRAELEEGLIGSVTDHARRCEIMIGAFLTYNERSSETSPEAESSALTVSAPTV